MDLPLSTSDLGYVLKAEKEVMAGELLAKQKLGYT